MAKRNTQAEIAAKFAELRRLCGNLQTLDAPRAAYLEKVFSQARAEHLEVLATGRVKFVSALARKELDRRARIAELQRQCARVVEIDRRAPDLQPLTVRLACKNRLVIR